MTAPTNAAKNIFSISAYSNRKCRARQARFLFPAAEICNFQAAPVFVNIRIMAEFSYKARRRSGELVEGVLDVADRPAALVQIQRLGLFPIAVETAKPGAATSGKRNGQKTDFLSLLPPTLRAQLSQKRKPKMQELATFTNQLANL